MKELWLKIKEALISALPVSDVAGLAPAIAEKKETE